MSESDKRQRELHIIKETLNNTGGQLLVQELATVWDVDTLIADSPQDTAYNVGLRDAYKFIKQLQDGDFINE